MQWFKQSQRLVWNFANMKYLSLETVNELTTIFVKLLCERFYLLVLLIARNSCEKYKEAALGRSAFIVQSTGNHQAHPGEHLRLAG